MKEEIIIITRHPGLVKFLKEQGIEGKLITHATAEDVERKIIYGVLPLHLACHAKKIISVDLDIPAEMRGKELTYDDVKKYYTGTHAYVVEEVEV